MAVEIRTYGKYRRSVRLKRDILIPAGTILNTAPERVEYTSDSVECVIGLTKDSHGHLTYSLDQGDSALTEWFEEVD